MNERVKERKKKKKRGKKERKKKGRKGERARKKEGKRLECSQCYLSSLFS